MSAQLGIFFSTSFRSARAAGMSMFWGQTRAHWPQPTQAAGRLSSGKAYTRMPMLKLGENLASLYSFSSMGMSRPMGQPSQQ